MKPFLAILLCLCTLQGIAQSDTSRVDVYDRAGKFVECRLIIKKAKPMRLFLLHSVQRRDTARNYITRIYVATRKLCS